MGRDREIDQWRVALDRTERGRTSQPFALYGLRGVGKTVLLSDFARAARKREWVVAEIEAGPHASFRQALGEALHGPLADLARPAAGRRLMKALKTALSFKASYDSSGTWSFGLDLAETRGGGADTGVLETDLGKLLLDLSAAAAEEGVGLAIVVDEAQDLALEELTALCSIAQTAGKDDWALLLAVAGLPSLPRVLAEAKSYAERLFVYQRIERLTGDVALEALTEPAAAEGVTWEDSAAQHVVRETQGHPYFLQQFGLECWNEATAPTVTLVDARVGAARGRAALDDGFFRARWDRATRAEQAYLRAMSPDGDEGSASREVAARLDKSPSSFGPARANLIAKGLVYAPEHGVVAFTVPGMAAFIQRQPSP